MKSSIGELVSAMKMYLKNTKYSTFSLKITRNAAEEMVEEYEKTQWVPCSERLPEPYVDVLVSLRPIDAEGEPKLRIGCRIDEEEWWVGAGKTRIGWIAAWIPLPKPYRENSED